jgi:hypothetical protein
LPIVKNLLDGPFGGRFPRLPDISHVQESRAIQPDINEG